MQLFTHTFVRILIQFLKCWHVFFMYLWAESGLWDHPDTGPGVWGGLSAGSTGQEGWPRLVHTAWEFRQQTIQTHPQTTLQHPQICKCSAHTLTHSLSSRSSVPLHFSTFPPVCIKTVVYECWFLPESGSSLSLLPKVFMVCIWHVLHWLMILKSKNRKHSVQALHCYCMQVNMLEVYDYTVSSRITGTFC